MAKMGRPQKQIDKNQFENLCKMHCTEVEIASFFDCDISTINHYCKREYKQTFSEVSNKYAQVGNISLRRTQYKLAEKSVPMAIWLGKQYLGQKDIQFTAEVDPETIKEVEEMVFNDDEEPGSSIPEN